MISHDRVWRTGANAATQSTIGVTTRDAWHGALVLAWGTFCWVGEIVVG